MQARQMQQGGQPSLALSAQLHPGRIDDPSKGSHAHALFHWSLPSLKSNLLGNRPALWGRVISDKGLFGGQVVNTQVTQDPPTGSGRGTSHFFDLAKMRLASSNVSFEPMSYQRPGTDHT